MQLFLGVVLSCVAGVAACGGELQGVTCSSNADCKLQTIAGSCSGGFCAYPDDRCIGGRYSPGAGPLANMCVEGPAACGAKDQLCCDNDLCGADLACVNATCMCGGDGQPCCGGTSCGTGFSCGTDSICSCGGLNEPCCGSTCDTALTCGSGGTCTGGVLDVAIGKGSICVLIADHTVWCWGHDELTFGRNDPVKKLDVIDFEVATRVPMLTDVAEIRGGDNHTCARKTDGTLWCWGHNENGQLGNNTKINSLTPVQVAGLSNVTMFDAGRFFTCAVGTVAATNTLYCWGRSGRTNNKTPGANAGESRLGNGTTDDKTTPSAVDLSAAAAAGQTVKSLTTGGYAACVVMTDSRVWCWGNNEYGELGDNTNNPSNVPVLVDLSQITIAGGVTIDEVSMTRGFRRYQTTCMRLSDGTVYCWGINQSGELGISTTGGSHLRPVTAVITTALGGAHFVSLTSMTHGHCGRDNDGAVWCWGRDKAGQMGNNDPTEGVDTTPVQAFGIGAITELRGNHHTVCALDGSGQMFCWGNNRRGQITKAHPTTLMGANVVQPVQVMP